MLEIGHEAATAALTVQPGAHIERHRHRWHQIVYPSRGAVSVTTAAGTWITPANRAIWIPAGQWHQHRFHGQTRFHAVALDPRRYRRVPATPAVVAVNPLLRELIIACSRSVDTGSPAHHRMLAVLHDHLDATDERQPVWLPTPVDERLRQACALVAADLSTPLTLAQIGRRIAVAERTLSRLFRTEFALTYPQWRTQLRLHHALALLAEDQDVTTVAGRCGWATPSAFIDSYRRVLGHTPGKAVRH
ncbi:helix-turn-helix transcriptional regulator [Mycobacterium koreense]|uniref:HTH-type transcriptional regulator RipA n=1 Tax=Mycolicibacillus koreensis TaxID=1069220 RepID=A0A7I7S7Y9_9MYCO|nr:helix-turn-helix transcriptional regulator [Mycolicibacillus koreensis]MCV7247866.1 helix-turn-helix transcriptional regulator [Mycolicibacillus koreensis]OSC33024.1 AraC family transcriptional regulator [Mycolicibacillus koreensis]BBY52994.1 AraC family transcriptional regulator [Mycolicibacillus koreensis]